MAQDFSGLEEKLGYSFKDKKLLEAALDWRNDVKTDARKFELLGDSLIGLIVSDELLRLPLSMREVQGFRSTLISNRLLAEVSNDLGLASYALTSDISIKKTFVASIFESVAYAIFLDTNRDYEATRKVVAGKIFSKLNTAFLSARHILPEERPVWKLIWEKYKKFPEYKFTEERAKNAITYRAEIYADGNKIAVGVGASKRVARTAAASEALRYFDTEKSLEGQQQGY